MTSRATSGASVSPLLRDPAINFGTDRNWLLMRKLGSDTFTPSGPNTSYMRFTNSSKYG